jgi:hypothetical protein
MKQGAASVHCATQLRAQLDCTRGTTVPRTADKTRMQLLTRRALTSGETAPAFRAWRRARRYGVMEGPESMRISRQHVAHMKLLLSPMVLSTET